MPNHHAETHYELLEIAPTASAAEIRRAYRRLAQELHPDRNRGDAAAAARMSALNEAYGVLSDARKREKYDLSLPSPKLAAGETSEQEVARRGAQAAAERSARDRADETRQMWTDIRRRSRAQSQAEPAEPAPRVRREPSRQVQVHREQGKRHSPPGVDESRQVAKRAPAEIEAVESSPRNWLVRGRSTGYQAGRLMGRIAVGGFTWLGSLAVSGVALSAGGEISGVEAGFWVSAWMVMTVVIGFEVFERLTSTRERIIAWGAPIGLYAAALLARFAF